MNVFRIPSSSICSTSGFVCVLNSTKRLRIISSVSSCLTIYSGLSLHLAQSFASNGPMSYGGSLMSAVFNDLPHCLHSFLPNSLSIRIWSGRYRLIARLAGKDCCSISNCLTFLGKPSSKYPLQAPFWSIYVLVWSVMFFITNSVIIVSDISLPLFIAVFISFFKGWSVSDFKVFLTRFPASI